MMASSVTLGILRPTLLKDVLLEGLSRLLLDAAQVTRGWRAVASAQEVGDETAMHLVPRGDRAGRKVHEPGAGTILDRHGKPVHHNLLVAVGRLDAQLIELQELSRVGCRRSVEAGRA